MAPFLLLFIIRYFRDIKKVRNAIFTKKDFNKCSHINTDIKNVKSLQSKYIQGHNIYEIIFKTYSLFKTVNIYYVTVVGQSNVKMSPVEFSLNKQVVPKHVSLFHQ